jgi:maltose alpha-D-glucosyltransferase/alpha-amylase
MELMEENRRLISDQLRKILPESLPDFLRSQRWFGGKADTIQSIKIVETVPFDSESVEAYLCLFLVEYASGLTQRYALPLALAAEGENHSPAGSRVPVARMTLESKGRPRVCNLSDALHEIPFVRSLLDSIGRQASFHGENGDVVAFLVSDSNPLSRLASEALTPSLMRVEQSNTSVRYGDQFILKFFRRLEEGRNLELEIGSFLTEKAHFKNTPPIVGAIEYRRAGVAPATLAILQGFVPNQGNAWQYTLKSLESYLERAAGSGAAPPEDSLGTDLLSEIEGVEISPLAQEERIGPYLGHARLLGQRTAELHLALASDAADPDFAPEPFTRDFQRSLSESMLHLARRALELLQSRLETLPAKTQESAQRVLSLEDSILSQFRALETIRLDSLRTRVHGDYHLGQVLYTGTDFIIIDFEGEPERSLAERRIKRSPLCDVAGMLRSFHYAAMAGFRRATQNLDASSVTARRVGSWTQFWKRAVSRVFLNSYLKIAGKGAFLPRKRKESRILLQAYLLDKAMYELVYELKNRPDWVTIPLGGISDLLW